jgi:integrase
MARRLKHTRSKNGKLQLFVRVHPGPGGLKTTTRDRLGTTQDDVDAWVKEQRSRYGGVTDVAGGLRATVAAYLAGRRDMPAHTKTHYTRMLGDWVHALGADRAPLSVDTGEITAVIQAELRRYAVDYVRKRRGVLFTFYKTMFPKHVNPVAAAVNPTPQEPAARELSYLDIDAAIASMPTYANRAGRPLNLAKIRLRAQAETGFPPGVLGAIRPAHLNFTAGTVYIDGREKGAGIAPRTVQLSPDAVEAFKAFHAAHAYGPWTPGSIAATNAAFKRACRRIGLVMHGVNQYILRHSFLSCVYRVSKDESTVQRVGLHAPGSRVTRRYTKAAHPEIDRAAVDAFSAYRAIQRRESLKAAPGQNRSQKLPKKVAQRRKSFRHAS